MCALEYKYMMILQPYNKLHHPLGKIRKMKTMCLPKLNLPVLCYQPDLLGLLAL